MTTNPFAKEIEQLEGEHKVASDLLQETKVNLDWFESFDLDQASLNLKRTERMAVETQAKLQQAQKRITGLKSSEKKLEDAASMGFDPRYWFSAERSIAKQRLAAVRQDRTDLQSEVAAMEMEIANAKKLGSKAQREIEMARKFDPLLAQSIIAAQKVTLIRIEPRLASLRQRRDSLNYVLMEPVNSLHKLEEKRRLLMTKISRAEAFGTQLNSAGNSHERAQIHNSCENELGDGSPGNVLRECRGELRRVDDKLAKLRVRIDSLVRFATFDIKHIVIDANNLCYEGRNFLKLVVLDALVPILTRKYKVTLIFDASIRRLLKMNNKDIEARFADAERVHVVASKRTADETVLDVAGDDPHTFVLSNDRFADYPEKLAVKDERILRHEIVGRVAYIHDLQIEAKFEIEQNAEVD